MSVIIDSNICNPQILTGNLNVKLTGPTDVCWGKPYRYQAVSFRQCYNTGCIRITRYEWAWDQGSPFKILNVENKDIVIESATIPFSGVHVLTVTAYDAENNSDVAFLNVNGTIGCTDTASVKIEGTTQACIDTEASFTANINHICNPICTSAITYIWKKNNDTIAVVDATDGQHQNYHTLQYTFTNTDIGINTISVEVVIAENVACTNKFYTLLDSTDVCVLSCSPNAGVTLTPFPDTVTTNTPVGFRAEVDLKCNPQCIPVESYTWTINGATTTTQSDRRYNLIDYAGYGSNTADIVTVKVTDIQGNETTATTDVDAVPPTALINTFDVKVIAPTKLCKTQTGNLTYIAVVQPWYNSSGVKTDVASYDWTIKDSGGNIIGSRTYTTSSLKDVIVLTSNPQVTHRVTCIVRDAGGRSVTRFADVLAVDCVDSSTTDFTVEKKSGEENPCIGISHTYEVGVTIQNPCITPIIEKYEWYINGSLVRPAIKPNLSDTYDAPPFLYTDPQDFRVVVTSEQGSTAETTFTVTPKSCVSVNIIGADKFDCVGSEPPRSQPDITCGPTGTHVRQIYTATTSSQTPIISYKWYTKKSSSNDWGDAIKTINGADLPNSDQAEISPDNKFQPIDIKVEVTDSNNYTVTAFKNNIETIACPPGPPCLSNETYIWILVDITGSMDSAKTEIPKAIFGWQHDGVTYGGLMGKILTQAYGGDEAVFKQRVHVRMQANEAIIGWMNLSIPFIQSSDPEYVEQYWDNSYQNSSSEVPPFFPLREADLSDPANPKPPGNVIILTISNESVGDSITSEMGRYYNNNSVPYWHNTDTPAAWNDYMAKVTPTGFRGGEGEIGDLREKDPGVLRYRGHIWNLRQTLNSIDATKTPGYFRGCFLLVNDNNGRAKGAFFERYVFNEKYCTDLNYTENHKADNAKDRGLWDYYMGNPASSKKWITASRPHLPNENKKGGIITASSGESHDRILMNFKIINNQLRQLGFTSLTHEDDGGLVYGDL